MLKNDWNATQFFSELLANNKLAVAEGFTLCKVSGRNTPRGNPGDIGKANGRKRKRWFSRKYFASVMNIQEFYADSLGQEFCRAISNALNPDIMRRNVTI